MIKRLCDAIGFKQLTYTDRIDACTLPRPSLVGFAFVVGFAYVVGFALVVGFAFVVGFTFVPLHKLIKWLESAVRRLKK